MRLKQAAGALESLGSETRLKIYRHLVRAGPGGLPVGTLQSRVGVPASTLSHHLSKLVENGLVSQEREGRVLRCRASYDTMRDLLDYLTEKCCMEPDDTLRA